jgi:hypothetical protein
MKHLSRVLSLALVIALSLGLVVTAGAKNVGDYPDSDAITEDYLEAVDVLTALGVFQGDDNGSLNPQNTFTRAQAAKIATYISIGTTAADRLSPRPSSFTDVATSHWANPFIEYAVEKGIVNGVGGGRFNPEGPVTGAQIAKMLLVALGYGVKGEYVGPSWEINAIVDGQARRILTVKTDYSAPAKREEVAQYTFNTIRPHGERLSYTYNPISGTYEVTGREPGGKNFLVKYTALIDDYILANSTTFQTGTAQYIGPEVFNLSQDPEYDDFGFDGHYWLVGARHISETFYKDGAILGDITGNHTVSTGMLYGSYAWNDYVEVWINGSYEGINSPDAYAEKNGFGPAFGAGQYVTLLDMNDDDKVDKLVITYGTLAKVTKVNAGPGTLEADRYYYGTAAKQTAKVIVEATGFAVGDYIIIVPDCYNAATTNTFAPTPFTTPTLSVEKANIITSKLTSYTISQPVTASSIINAITTGGKTYYVADTEAITHAGSLGYASDVILYLDSHDSVVGYEGTAVTAASLNYLFVEGITATFGTPSAVADNRLSVVYGDGTRAVVEVAFTTDSAGIYKPAGTNAPAVGDVDIGKWFSYTLDSTGKVVLRALAVGIALEAYDDDATAATKQFDISPAPGGIVLSGTNFSTEIAAINGKYITSSTVLKINGRTYTGYTNLPPFTSGGTTSPPVASNDAILVILAERPVGTPTSSIAAIYVFAERTAAASGEYGIIAGWVKNEAIVAGEEGVDWYNVKNAKDAGPFGLGEELPDRLSPSGARHLNGTVVEIITETIGGNTVRSVGASQTTTQVALTITEIDTAESYLIANGQIYYYSTATQFFDASVPFGGTEYPQVGDVVSIYGGTTHQRTDPVYAIVKTFSVAAALEAAIDAADTYKFGLIGTAPYSFDAALTAAKAVPGSASVGTMQSATTTLNTAVQTYKDGLVTAKGVWSSYTESSTTSAQTAETAAIVAALGGAEYLAASGGVAWAADNQTVTVTFADGTVGAAILLITAHT